MKQLTITLLTLLAFKNALSQNFVYTSATTPESAEASKIQWISDHDTISPDDITVRIKVYLNQLAIITNSLSVKIANLKTQLTYTFQINQEFNVYLAHDMMYSISFSHPNGFCTKTILVNTKCPFTNKWLINSDVYLYTEKPDEVTGVLYYDPKTDSFQAGPYKK